MMKMWKLSGAGISDQCMSILTIRFCEREFDDKMVLTAHQKARHFTCQVCSKKLNSVAGTSFPFS